MLNLGVQPRPLAALPLPQFTLDRASDTGTRGDDRTASGTVTLVGTAAPCETVQINLGGTTTVLPNGLFAFFDVPLTTGANDVIVTAPGTGSTARTITRLGAEDNPPVVTLTLATDTGRSDKDRITSDAGLSIRVADASRIVSLQLVLNNGAAVDLADRLVLNSLTLTQADLVSLFDPLADGSRLFTAVATDAFGNVSTTTKLSFVLDTTPPGLPSDRCCRRPPTPAVAMPMA